MEGRDAGGREGCDGNFEVGEYGMEWVHNREPKRSRVASCKIKLNHDELHSIMRAPRWVER